MTDLEQRLRICLQEVADTTSVPDMPMPMPANAPPRRSRWSRQWLVTGAVSVGVVVASGGLAVAGDPLYGTFNVFGHTRVLQPSARN